MISEEGKRADIFSLEISEQAKDLFYDLAKWAKLLAIVGFIVIGLSAGAAIYSFIIRVSHYADVAYSVGELLGAFIILGVPVYGIYAMHMHAKKLKKALDTTNQQDFEKGIRQLRNSIRYTAIVSLICLAIYFISVFILVIEGRL